MTLFDLKQYIEPDCNNIRSITDNFDFKKINQILDAERNKSLNFINALL